MSPGWISGCTAATTLSYFTRFWSDLSAQRHGQGAGKWDGATVRLGLTLD
jgi:hypothetical protein